MPAVHDAVFGC